MTAILTLRGPEADVGEVSGRRDLKLQARAFVPDGPVARNGRTLGITPAYAMRILVVGPVRGVPAREPWCLRPIARCVTTGNKDN
jgi:hypothetical protein